MAKLIMYKNNFFWLRAVNFDQYDMEFEIYNLGGQCVGSTVYGIKDEANLFSSEEEKEEFMNWVEIEAHKEEATMKFAFQFNLQVEQAKQLELSAVEIMDIMKSTWSIPIDIMDAILP